MAYDPRTAEPRWQQYWRDARVFEARPESGRPKFYCLEMLPYPSGRLHVGHVRNYALGDAMAWFQRLQGRDVFHPIGWDAMGLPAENAAIKQGVAPAEWTLANIAHMRGQLQRLGLSYDWNTETTTCLPEYYRWNQWFFLRMLERDMVYRAKRLLNWCPECATVLAEAQVTPNNTCWRHENTQVEKALLDQWFVRITRYRDRLLDGLDTIEANWPERIVGAQREWIGRSEGCRFAFRVEDRDESIEVFTTRVDTAYGCAAVFLAAGHALVPELARGTAHEAAVVDFVAQETEGPQQNPDEKDKRGIFTGRYAINPWNGARVPIWAANFVLAEFGTGAVFAQPAHDQRDFEFARKYGLTITPVIRAEDGTLPDAATMTEALTTYGVLADSGPFTGMTTTEARAAMAAYAEEHGFGRAEVQYRLRDWGIARQRYWGTPIPVIYCDACGIVPVPDDQLPVVLPHVPEWKGQTGSPLQHIESFVNTTCPRCGGPARRETDTMDTFVDSSWYFLRYLDPHNDTAPFDSARAAHFMPVDLYIGGAEHATGHLIYFRFWTKFVRDLGLVDVEEPATRLFTQGMVRASSYRCPTHDYIRVANVDFTGDVPRCPHCGTTLDVHVDKMSKSKFNDADLDHLVERYGADAVRLAVLFGGPPAKDFEWKDSAIEGPWRFTQRIARLFERYAAVLAALPETPADPAAIAADSAALAVRKATHRTVARVTNDLAKEIQLNTAIAAQMELVNEIYRHVEGPSGPVEVDPSSPLAAAIAEALHALVRLLAPLAPHLAEEMNEALGMTGSIASRRWPVADPALLVEDEVVLPVQVLGKLRGQVTVPRGADQATVLAAVQGDAALARHLEGKTLARVVLVPDRLVNLVVKG